MRDSWETPENRDGVPFNSSGGPVGYNQGGNPVGDREAVRLLRELVETQKKSLRTARLALFLCVLTLAAVAAVIPSALGTLRRADASLQRVSDLADTVETAAGNAGAAVERIGDALSGLDGGGLSGLLSDGQLAEGVRSFQEGMNEFRTAMGRLNAIDFDALNQAIRDLSDMAAPLRQLAGLLNR